MKFTVLTDFDGESIETAADKVAIIQAIARDAAVLVERPDDLLLIHELRQYGITIKAACLGHVEKKLVAPWRPGEAN